jgi:hypothetical protein
MNEISNSPSFRCLGLPAIFQSGGLERSDKAIRVPVMDSDVTVWGGARLGFAITALRPQKRANIPSSEPIATISHFEKLGESR